MLVSSTCLRSFFELGQDKGPVSFDPAQDRLKSPFNCTHEPSLRTVPTNSKTFLCNLQFFNVFIENRLLVIRLLRSH